MRLIRARFAGADDGPGSVCDLQLVEFLVGAARRTMVKEVRTPPSDAGVFVVGGDAMPPRMIFLRHLQQVYFLG